MLRQPFAEAPGPRGPRDGLSKAPNSLSGFALRPDLPACTQIVALQSQYCRTNTERRRLERPHFQGKRVRIPITLAGIWTHVPQVPR